MDSLCPAAQPGPSSWAWEKPLVQRCQVCSPARLLAVYSKSCKPSVFIILIWGNCGSEKSDILFKLHSWVARCLEVRIFLTQRLFFLMVLLSCPLMAVQFRLHTLSGVQNESGLPPASGSFLAPSCAPSSPLCFFRNWDPGWGPVSGNCGRVAQDGFGEAS